MTTFTDWLRDQTEHPDDYVRTLAREVADDPDWPATARSLRTFTAYPDEARRREIPSLAWSAVSLRGCPLRRVRLLQPSPGPLRTPVSRTGPFLCLGS
jgi:hypothetical protein